MMFQRYAWFVLVYNVAVILWGAYVRATGSGAGCGNNWPLCTGNVIPRSPRADTLIEFSHRAMSGLALILIFILVVWAFRRHAMRPLVRFGAAASMSLILIEALVGAGLVVFELVADNISYARAFVGALHLANTFLLLGALSLTASWSTWSPERKPKLRSRKALVLLAALLGVILIGMSGAITALGDTLFPAETLASGISLDLDPTAHLLVRMRIFHPGIALGVSLFILWLLNAFASDDDSGRSVNLRWALSGVVVIQLIAGPVNLFLLAPVWMQILHLLLANIVWIILVVYSDFALRQPISRAGEAASE
jgi:heme A synthase